MNDGWIRQFLMNGVYVTPEYYYLMGLKNPFSKRKDYSNKKD
jgi:hypothetical protein